MQQRALVTGANGFMGTYMTDLLSRAGMEIVATDVAPASSYEPTGAYQTPFAYRQCDIRDENDVALLLNGEKFDYVFHLAALCDFNASGDEAYAVNVGGTRALLAQLELYKCFDTDGPRRFVLWGSGGIYDFDRAAPAKETSPTLPRGTYLASKLESERVALDLGRSYGIGVTVVRPGAVYGPRSRFGIANALLVAARGGLGPFTLGKRGHRAGLVHAEDVCRAALFLAQRPEAANECYNVVDDSQYATRTLIGWLGKRMGFPALPLSLPAPVLHWWLRGLQKRAAAANRTSLLNADMVSLLTRDALLDGSKLRQLGWKPRHPDAIAGLNQTIAWYERNGWL